MCKYCYADHNYGSSLSAHFILQTPQEKVYDGVPEVSIGLQRNEQDAWELCAGTYYAENQEYKMQIKIKYCPMCGRNLDQWEGEMTKAIKGDSKDV